MYKREYNVGIVAGACEAYSKTRHDAKWRLENDTWSEYNMCERTGSYWAYEVECLLNACKTKGTNNNIILDADMIHTIF